MQHYHHLPTSSLPLSKINAVMGQDDSLDPLQLASSELRKKKCVFAMGVEFDVCCPAAALSPSPTSSARNPFRRVLSTLPEIMISERCKSQLPCFVSSQLSKTSQIKEQNKKKNARSMYKFPPVYI
jgi:hypothetical protein